MKKHLDLLGFPVVDKVTGFEGVVTSIAFDLYGCIQAIVQPASQVETIGKMPESYWFDISRLDKMHDYPVMDVPNFDNFVDKGPAGKPKR